MVTETVILKRDTETRDTGREISDVSPGGETHRDIYPSGHKPPTLAALVQWKGRQAGARLPGGQWVLVSGMCFLALCFISRGKERYPLGS